MTMSKAAPMRDGRRGAGQRAETMRGWKAYAVGAAVLTLLPLMAVQLICLPDLPAPLQIFGKSGAVILLESVRLA